MTTTRLTPRPFLLTAKPFLILALLFASVAAWHAAPAPAFAQEEEAATEESAEEGGEGEQSALGWLIETSGWIGGVILLLSMYFVAAVTRGFLELRRKTIIQQETVEEVEALIDARDYTGAYKRASGDGTYFGTVVSAGMAELRNGLPEAREAMDRTADGGTTEMERKISMIAVLGTLGPMIGLLGTLKGMIASFSVIATSDTQLKPSEVAGGISEALLLTFEGVGLSVPAIFFFAFFRNKINSLTGEANTVADALIRKLNTAIRTKPAAAPGQAPPVPPATA